MSLTEIRFEVERDQVSVLDGYVQATGKSRADVLRQLLAEWSEMKLHEATLICRTAGVNPAQPESHRASRFHA